MTLVLISVVLGAFALAVWISGVGLAPYVVVDAVIPVLVVPAALVMIGVSPRQFVSAFSVAIRPGDSPSDELAAARVVITGFSRLTFISVGVFVTIGAIAMLHDLPADGSNPLRALMVGDRTLIVDVLYALILQALLIHPLLIRLDRRRSLVRHRVAPSRSTDRGGTI
jgi:hypothetical protein